MTDDAKSQGAPENDTSVPEAEWDASQVMRRRAELAQEQRDRAIAELRDSLTDEEAVEQFGIDLREIER